jgi:hypothetical protein
LEVDKQNQGASGTVRVFLDGSSVYGQNGKDRWLRTWWRSELPTLLRNRAVTNILAVDARGRTRNLFVGNSFDVARARAMRNDPNVDMDLANQADAQLNAKLQVRLELK